MVGIPNRHSWLSIEQIRAARALADLDQKQAADACGVPYPSWRGMERKRGRRHIQRKQMDKIVAGFEALGIRFSVDGVEYADGHGPGDRSHQMSLRAKLA